MKLYYSPGACSLAVHIALREAGRAFDLERVDLRTHRTSNDVDYLAVNPKGYVPALVLDPAGNEILTEAQVILQYIADLVPHLMLAPAPGTIARYRMQEWLSFISSELHKQFGLLFRPDTPERVKEWQRGKIADRLAYVSDDLYDKGYVMGETFTVVDAYLYPILRWCDRFDIDRQLWSNLADYYLRIDERPAVQQALVAEGLLEPKRANRVMPATGSAHP
jgi:glutathione S-transferase